MSNRTTGQFIKITEEMASLYERKNKDYGDAFSNEVKDSGWGYATGLLGNKVRRVRNLLLHTEQHPEVKESVEDTLLDLANYAIMTLMEVRNHKEPSRKPSHTDEDDDVEMED